MTRIPLDELEVGRVYKVQARNLDVAVYVGDGIFRGIREKFRSQFLDDEYHWDISKHCGTVSAMESLDIILSSEVGMFSGFPTECKKCGKLVEWTGPPAPADWKHSDNSSADHPVWPVSRQNKALFEFLDNLEKQLC